MRTIALALPPAALVLAVFGLAHAADRVAYGLAIQARGLGPVQGHRGTN